MRFAAGFMVVLAACQGDVRAPTESRETILGSNALSSNALSSNALSSNALSSNALSSNALSSNALSSNALSSNALSSNALRPDGQTEGAVARQFLTYLYSCAMPAGASMHLVIDGGDYGTYSGAVGLAPEWGAEGGSCDGRCQRWVTACLLARTNFWGVPVKISLRGPHEALGTTDDERGRYPLREGTYFGNLFDRTGGQTPRLFACAGPGSNLPQLTNRFCSGANGPCDIEVALDCLSPRARPLARPVDPDLTLPTRYACERQDPNDGSMLGCWTAGVSIYGDDPTGDFYPEAITVALQAPVAICGDGVCTGGETAATCSSDCSTGWARSFAGELNIAFGFGTLPGGDLYTLIITESTTDLGGGPLKTLPGEQSLLLGRFDASGVFQEAHRVGYGPIDNVSSADDDLPGIARHVIADAAGNIYIAVQIGGDFWVGDQLVAWSEDAPGTLLSKIGPDGDVLWTRTEPEQLASFALRPDGTPLLMVQHLGAPHGPPGGPPGLVGGPINGIEDLVDSFDAAGTRTARFDVGPVNGDSYVILAVDPDGDPVVVHRTFSAPEMFRLHLDTGARDDFDAQVSAGDISSAAFAPGGDLVAVARIQDNMTGSAVPRLMRFAPDGQLRWAKLLGGAVPGQPVPVALPVRVSVNPAGDIAVVGVVETAVDLENDVLVGLGGGTIPLGLIFVAKYSSTGVKRWVKGLGGGGYNLATTASLLDDGSVLVAGGFSNSGVYDGWLLENPEGGGIGLTMNSYLVRIPDR